MDIEFIDLFNLTNSPILLNKFLIINESNSFVKSIKCRYLFLIISGNSNIQP